MRRLVLLAALVAMAACAPAAEPTPTGVQSCEKGALPLTVPGQLTVGTDAPAFPPWFVDDEPRNGMGFESAVAYAVAGELGFSREEVAWTVVPFNASFAPGGKAFDFDVGQISITPERQQAVDFSDGYYTVGQAVVALRDSPIAGARSVADLRGARLGSAVGTTSLRAITEVVRPGRAPAVFNDYHDAVSSVRNGQVDGIVVDLPTAFFITSAEVPEATIVGQLPPPSGAPEEFGLLFEKGNPLVGCVNQALDALRSSGELERMTQRWLSESAGAPMLSGP
ncbi:MAG: ABC transporter substrate-binding protein [Egibacteraceae bacterium]